MDDRVATGQRGVGWAMRVTLLALCLGGVAVAGPEPRPVPGMLTTEALGDFASLDPARQRLVKTGLTEAARLMLNRYVYGSADARRGGFDCSGAVFYLLEMLGIDAPRTSSAQFEWVRAAGLLHVPDSDAVSLDHPCFQTLLPGDLLFWSGTYTATDGRANQITHVQIYLGREPDGRAVMLGSTDGRSYRGTPRCGFGVFDFKLPGPGSTSRFAGFGRPPGLTAP